MISRQISWQCRLARLLISKPCYSNLRTPYVKQHKRPTSQEIILLVVIKLIAIAALWWIFFRDAQVTVTPTSAAEHFGTPLRSPTLPGEKTHD